MVTKTQNPTPFSRLSRIGFGLGTKSNSRLEGGTRQSGADDEWYIPYNGPYEAPPEPSRRQKERDSWGDPVYGEDEDDAVLASRELQKLYGPGPEGGDGIGRFSGDGYGDLTRNSRPRDRIQSGVSGRTVSSGAVDPSRASIGTQRRSTVSSSHRPPVPSFINLDAAGGVGESPMPLSREPSSTNRTSIANILNFGVPSRKIPSSPKNVDNNVNRLSRKLVRSERLSSSSRVESRDPVASLHRRSSSSGSYHLRQEPVRPRKPTALKVIGDQGVETPDDEDYYNSYYSTLLSPGRPSPNPAQHLQPPPPIKASISSIPQHPYAYVFPTSEPKGPHSAPIRSPNTQPHNEHPRLMFTEAPQPQNGDVAQLNHRRPFTKSLKNSVSTPNFKIATGFERQRPSKPSLFPKAKDRWLSAETWCDALMFPRPRLKVKQDGAPGYKGSGRIVSPPGSPIVQQSFSGSGGEHHRGLVSRVLAHSKSLVDLREATDTSPEKPAPRENPPITPVSPPQNGLPTTTTLRPPRPKSFALDDLALPSPIPSLARVLEENQILSDQREEWRSQATKSFQNKRSRSLSRTRSKSLARKGKRKDDPPPSNIDFLAARACLGDQSVIPIVGSREHSAANGTSSRGTFSRTSHSNSNSLVKTLSKSPKSHSRAHSRTDSWGKSALKLAKTATCGMTGSDPSMLNSRDEMVPGLGLELALKREGTRVIRLADPAQISVNKELSTPTMSTSPTPSGISDSRIGIALSTPPLVDDKIDIQLLSHPYAQGGRYSHTPAIARTMDSRPEKRSEYAGPHPSMTIGSQPTLNPDVSSRHRLPPQAALHPYAQALAPDLYTGVEKIVREDSDVPPPAKMWAQLSPGVLREILPNDIQYSPFMSESGQDSARNSQMILDTVGVGEALAYAIRPKASKDSGLGTSEDHTLVHDDELGRQQTVGASRLAKRSYRQPVQYDATRPSYLSQGQKASDPYSAHTFSSSPLIPPPTPPTLRYNESTGSHDIRGTSTSPGMISEDSSTPHSPQSLGSPDDLENYRDLFFKPRTQQREPSETNTMASIPFSWDANSRSRRTGSGLTSLARQLSAEFEQMALERERERESSHYSRDSMPMSPRPAPVRKPTDTSLEFVFEETSQFGSRNGSVSPPDYSTISAFHPSMKIPEDVESSRSSSPVDPDEDVTERYRVGMVGSVSTPPTVSSDRRASHTGLMSFVEGQMTESVSSALPRINSSLQPSDPTRNSYMTTSTGSRMSELSDFPAPPRKYATHLPILSPYFDEVLSQNEARTSRSSTPPMPIPSDGYDRRLTFGGDEDIDELVAALSQHSHSSHS